MTIPGDVAGTWVTGGTGTGLSIAIDLGSGSNFNATAGAWVSSNLLRTAASTSFVSSTAGSTFNFTGVQLEIGSLATTFEQRNLAAEEMLCRRYFVKYTSTIVSGYGLAGQGQYTDIVLSPNMRTSPSASSSSINYSNMNTASVLTTSYTTARLFSTFTATGNGYSDFQGLSLSAEL